jgi:phage terminase large subunit-like protein
LNIWSTSENPWLRIEDWNKCRVAFDEEDLHGQWCYAGLDLAKTRDMTALALVFREPDEAVKILPYYWLPDARVDDLAQTVPQIKAWVRDGFIRKTPGDVCDYTFIKRDIAELAKKFNITELAYDPYNAEQLTQELEQGTVRDGVQIEEGTGLRRFAFAQTIMNYAGPTGEFQRLVESGKLNHNGHPVLTWQAGHVKVREDANKNKRPTIDGIVAGVMALSRWMGDNGGDRTVYERESRGFIEIG